MSESIRGARLPQRALRLHVLNVGHGDALLVQFPRGTWGVVDAGSQLPPASLDVGGLILRYLRAWDVTELAFLCVTHPHRDHDSGIRLLLESELNIGEFWRCGYLPVPGRDQIRPDWEAYMHAALRRRDAGRLAMPPAWHVSDHRNIDGVEITCLAPTPQLVEQAVRQWRNPNNASLVLALTWEHRTMLLGGDAEQPAWDTAAVQMAALALPRAQIFKIPHHGSRRGVPPAALPAVAETGTGYAAIITCTREAGFPNGALLEAIWATRGQVWCTTRCAACPEPDAEAGMVAARAMTPADLALAALGAGRPASVREGPEVLIASLLPAGRRQIHVAHLTGDAVTVLEVDAADACGTAAALR